MPRSDLFRIGVLLFAAIAVTAGSPSGPGRPVPVPASKAVAAVPIDPRSVLTIRVRLEGFGDIAACDFLVGAPRDGARIDAARLRVAVRALGDNNVLAVGKPATVLASADISHAGVASGVNNAVARSAGLLAGAASGLGSTCNSTREHCVQASTV